jgi:hypothetical protein
VHRFVRHNEQYRMHDDHRSPAALSALSGYERQDLRVKCCRSRWSIGRTHGTSYSRQ